MASEWAGVVKTTAPKYLKGFEDNTIRSRRWLNGLKERGRISFNNHGLSTYWQVAYAQPPVEAYADGGVVDYSRFDAYQQANLDWRGYITKDALTKKEMLINGTGDTQLINRYKQTLPRLLKGITDKMGTEMYVDGNAPGNANRLHGIESFMGADTTYDSVGADVADKIAKPSDTYAGLSTALGALGGSWDANLGTKPNANVATDWPHGAGTSEYDYWSPKLINTVSMAWTGTATWASTCEKVLRQTTLWCTLTAGEGGSLDQFLLSGDLYSTYLDTQALKQRILVGASGGGELGLPGTYTQEGVKIDTEFGIPASTGYGINFDAMEFLCMGSQMFESQGPDYDPHTLGYLFLVHFFGNMRFNPKGFAKLYPYAAS